jgi:hypothetical protein
MPFSSLSNVSISFSASWAREHACITSTICSRLALSQIRRSSSTHASSASLMSRSCSSRPMLATCRGPRASCEIYCTSAFFVSSAFYRQRAIKHVTRMQLKKRATTKSSTHLRQHRPAAGQLARIHRHQTDGNNLHVAHKIVAGNPTSRDDKKAEV